MLQMLKNKFLQQKFPIIIIQCKIY